MKVVNLADIASNGSQALETFEWNSAIVIHFTRLCACEACGMRLSYDLGHGGH